MVKRIGVLLQRDLKNGLRDNIFLYALLAPVILTLFIRFLLPLLMDNSYNVVVLEEEKERFSQLTDFAQVEHVATLGELKERVLKWDDALGIIGSDGKGKYTIISEGNEANAVITGVGAALNQLTGILAEVEIQEVDLTKTKNPIYQVFTIMMCLFPLMISGMLTAFSMAEEKEFKTRQALKVSPLSELEYIVGKTLLGMAIAFGMVIIIIIILGVEVNWLQLLLITGGGVFLSMIYGFSIAAISNNQLTALANSKIGSMFFIIPPLVAVLIPKSKEFFLYWLPTYWTFAGYRSLFWERGTWSSITGIFTWNMVTNSLFFLLAYLIVKKYEKGE